MNATADQTWLNAHGASLKVDGKAGAKTRAAIIEVFRNTDAPAIKYADMVALASLHGFDLRAMRAVAKVESGRNGGWDASGLLSCLYERHYLFRRVGVAFGVLSQPKGGGYTIDANGNGINDSWEKLADASCRWGMATAFECASFGKFQIMGAHWKSLGYASVLDFVWRMSRDEAAHYDAFARYIKANGLTAALNRVDGNPDNCRAIARGYNGKGYEKFDYHRKIAAAWKVMA